LAVEIFIKNKLLEKGIDLPFKNKNYYSYIKEKQNLTFKNKLSKTPKFVNGDLVLHRQMQVSTGASSKWKPLFTGPYVINEIDKQNRTAVCQNISTGKTIKAHFNNLVIYECDPKKVTLPASSWVYNRDISELK
jgi:hypothetical protein